MRRVGCVETDMTIEREGIGFTTEAPAPWSYRDAEAALRARRGELILARRAEAADADPRVRRIYQHRVARIAAGMVAIVGAATLPLLAIVPGKGMTGALLATTALAGLTWCGAFRAARARFSATVMGTIAETFDLYRDVERLERGAGGALAANVVDRLERMSVAIPMIGLALVLPLLLHFAFFVTVMMPFRTYRLGDFDEWIKLSLFLVSQAHLLLAWLSWRFAKRLRSVETPQIPLLPSGWPAWGWTIMAAAFPGAFLIGIPPAIVAATGILFVPTMFSSVRRRVAEERRQLGC